MYQSNKRALGRTKKITIKDKRLARGQLVPYAQGTLLNSKLNLSKYYILGSYKNRTCNLMIKNFSSSDEGKYHCQYVENDTTISRFYRVNIKSKYSVYIIKFKLKH